MKVEYNDKKVEKMCTDCYYQKKMMPEKEAKELQKLMYKIAAADNLAFFTKPENRKHRLEKLQGNRRFQLSLRTQENSGYRIIFECTNTDIKDDYINMNAIKIIEVTNHEY